MKKFLLALTFTAAAFSGARAQEIFNDDVRKSFEETQAALQQSADRMNKQMQEVMPIVAGSMSQMMQNVFNTIPPLMKSLEENQVLSKAAEQLNNEIDAQTKELNASISPQTNESAPDKFVISGSRDDNGRKIDFNFSQNDEALKELQNALDIKTNPQNKENFSLKDLKNQKLRGRDFRLEAINGQNYLVYDDGDTYCYVTGIMNNNIIVRILTTGEDAPARARNFIKNSNQKFMPAA